MKRSRTAMEQDTGSGPDALDGRAARLFEITVALNSTRELEPLLTLIVESAAEVLECEGASILLYEEEARQLRFAAASGPAARRLKDVTVPLEGSIAGAVFLENRPVVTHSAPEDARHFDGVRQATEFVTRDLLGVPMLVDGRATGVLQGVNKRQGRFGEADAELLSVVAAQAAIAVRNARQLESLRQANETLEHLDRLKTSIMSISSHELRTPLSAVLGYAAVLKDTVPEDLQEFAGEVLDAGERMRSVVESMSEMLDLLARERQEQRALLDVRTVVQQAVAEARKWAADHWIEVELEGPAGVVRGDAGQLRGALLRMLDNAVRFSPDGGRIRIREAPQGEQVEIAVTDEGIGMRAEILERVFDEFYQAEDHLTRTYGGLGLGLTYVREVARLHGGRVRAFSEGPGRGSTFRLWLPAEHLDRQAAEAEHDRP